MKAIFSSPHLIEVAQKRDLLEQQGIACEIFNENNAFAAEGTITLGMPELWIQDESRLLEAQNLLREIG